MLGPIPSALIVEDNFVMVELLTIMLEYAGLRVVGSAATAEEAVAQAHRHRPAVVLIDLRLSGPEEGDVAAAEISRSVGSSIIYMTGVIEEAANARMAATNPAAILIKPVSEALVRDTVLRVLAERTCKVA